MINNKRKELEQTINNIKDGIIPKYQEYEKYNYMTIHIILKYQRAKQISKFIKEGNHDLVKQYMKYYSKCDLLEQFIECFFEDIPYNFIINLKEIINYMVDNPNYHPKGIDLYKKLLSFDELNIQQIKKLYNDYNTKDTAKMFYQDFRLARDMAYQDINKNLLNVTKDIMYLNGQEFYLCIHSSNNQYWNTQAKVLSLSLISHDNISHYGQKTRHLIYGFSNLKIDHIIHIYHADSYTSYTYGTDKPQRILTPSKLIQETKKYNEIFYKLDESIKPDLLICFDKITNEHLMLANEMNLKIVVINSKKYQEKTGKEHIFQNNYITKKEQIDYDILKEVKKMK